MNEKELNAFLDLDGGSIRFRTALSETVGAHHLTAPGATGALPLLRVHHGRMDYRADQAAAFGMEMYLLERFHSVSMAEFVAASTDLIALLRNPGSSCCTERVTGE